MFPRIVFAQETLESNVASFMEKIFDVLVQPALIFFFTLALVLFLWGMMVFLTSTDKNAEDSQKGKQHMLWGIIGMFVMMAVFGIMRLIISTLGIDV